MKKLSSRLAWFAPILFGAVVFFVVVGSAVLNPANIGWLRDTSGDSFTHYLGWAFFRNSPWTMPLGANPDYGLEVSNSILYSDSIPLLAFLLKTMSHWLPPVFQYTGWWLLSCFVLQAVFAWHLVGIATSRFGPRLAGAALFVVSPPMLFRLYGHWALVGHWILLAALYLSLRPTRKRQAICWVSLAVVAALVHTYLLVLTLALWFAAWLGDLWGRKRGAVVLASELAVVPAACLAVLWQAGFFLVRHGKEAGGFGGFRLNLNALVNPWGWSRVLPTLPAESGDYEGFAYLGLGLILAALIASPAAVRLRRRGELTFDRTLVPLAVVLAGLTLYAMSNRVALGLHVIEFPLPPWMILTASMMRASGRLFWPVFYLLLFGIVAVIVRAYSSRVSSAILVTALLLQVFDLSPGWSHYGPRFRKRAASRSQLTSGFWYEAPADYHRVRLVPWANQLDDWRVFAEYAQRQHMATNAVYLARIDRDNAARMSDETTAALLDGHADPAAMFVLQDSTARWVSCAMDTTRDQLASIDGFWVLMPGWRTRHGERYAGKQRLGCRTLSPDGEPFAFVRGSDAAGALVSGWSLLESWGIWSDGARSVLLFRLSEDVSRLQFTVSPAQRPGPPLEVQISVDGQQRDTWVMSGFGQRVYDVPVSRRDGRATEDRRKVTVEFTYSDTRSPSELGGGQDRRRLAMALHQVRALR